MRNGIRQRLITAIPAISGRVLDRHEGEGTADKPYLILAQGVEVEDNAWSGFHRIYKIWPCELPTAGFGAVDALADSVIQALDGEVLTDPDSGEKFVCRYMGAIGTERVYAQHNAISHGLRFRVEALRSEALAESVPADEWLQMLGTWTASQLGSDWRIYLGQWPSDYERPAVLWRLAGVEPIGGGSAAAVELRKQFIGHVWGRMPDEQSAALSHLTEQLALSRKLLLHAAERRYLTVREQTANAQADERLEGQLQLKLSRRVIRPTLEEPLMREVHYQQRIQ